MIGRSCPFNVKGSSLAVATSHSFTAPTLSPVASDLPFGDKAICSTGVSCSPKTRNSLPFVASKSLTVLSHDTDASNLPSMERSKSYRKHAVNLCNSCPLAIFQHFTLSLDVEASVLPSSEKATVSTKNVCPI